MRPAGRLFELITLLRTASRPITGAALAERLEVSVRSVYRDIATLQAMHVPILGERGIGYVMRPGFDLPPLMFTDEEAEALILGLGMLQQTGDPDLDRNAARARDRILAVLPPSSRDAASGLFAWQDPLEAAAVPPAILRQAIREERKLDIAYRREDGTASRRIIRPIALVYYNRWLTLTGWCELRDGFRSFRADRIDEANLSDDHFRGEGDRLRTIWMAGWKRPDEERPA